MGTDSQINQGQPAKDDSLRQQAIIAEYNALRQEALGFNQAVIQAGSIGVPVAAAFAAFGYQASSFAAMLGAALTLSATIWLVLSQYSQLFSRTTYIYAVLEEHVPGLQYEHLTFESRPLPGSWILIILGPFGLIFGNAGLILLAWFFLPDHNAETLWAFGVAAAVIAISTISAAIYAPWIRSIANFKRRVKRWDTIALKYASKHPS